MTRVLGFEGCRLRLAMGFAVFSSNLLAPVTFADNGAVAMFFFPMKREKLHVRERCYTYYTCDTVTSEQYHPLQQ